MNWLKKYVHYIIWLYRWKYMQKLMNWLPYLLCETNTLWKNVFFFSVSPSFWVTHFLLKMCYSKRSSWIDLTCTMNRATSPLNCLPSDTARLVEDKDIMTLFFWLSIAPVFLGLLWPSQQMMGIGLAVNSRGKSHCCLKAMVVVWAFSYVEGHRPQHCE